VNDGAACIKHAAHRQYIMKIFVVGLSHKTAPVSVRDRVAISADDLKTKLDALKNGALLKESFILSTCNRTELYGLIPRKCSMETEPVSLFKSLHPGMDISLDEHLYYYTAEEAVRHLFRVSAGLDSLALGEPQIFGQVKEAYKIAARNNNTGQIFNRLLHKTFSATKNIRTNTRIGEGTTSIGFAAVEMAQKIFGDLSPMRIMVVGAGETGTLTAHHFHKRGVARFLIANRTYERGEKLAASLGGAAIRFNQIDAYLSEVDVVVTCVGADDAIIVPGPVEQTMKERKNRPLFFIDLGAPRDVDPKVKALYNVFVFNIDDLREVVESNRERRKHEVAAAEAIIEREINDFFEWYGTIGVLPTIQKLQDRFEKIRKAEIDANSPKLNGCDLSQIELLTRSIIKKILRAPILYLKENARTPTGMSEAEALKKIFSLDDKPPEDAAE